MRQVLSAALAGSVALVSAKAQCTPVWAVDVPSTSPTSSTDFIESANAAVVMDPDGPGGQPGRIFVGCSGPLSAGVVREWTPAGWSPVGSNLGFPIASLAVWDQDGAGPGAPMLVAGNNNLAGLSAWDGSDWRQVGGGVGGPVLSMVAFDDGANPGRPSLFIAGGVRSLAGPDVHNIARWDGSCWSDLAGGANSSVYALAVFDADGDGPGAPALCAAGAFTSIGGVAANRIARWDGSAWSAVGLGFGAPVYALEVLDLDGPGPGPALLYAGGEFSTADGLSARGVAAFNGAAWSGFGSGLRSRVLSLAAYDPDGDGPEPASLYAGGTFRASVSSADPRYIARWNGTDWVKVGNPPVESPEFLLPVDFDGPGPGGPTLLAGGPPSTETAEIPNSIVGVWDGTAWSSPPRGINGEILAMTPFDADGAGPQPARLLVGGAFTHGDGQRLGGIAEDVEGALLPVGSGTDGMVRAIAAWDADGTGAGNAVVVAGGLFAQAGGSTASNIARWDGAEWSPLGPGLNSTVESLASADLTGSGHPLFYAGGRFDHAGTLAANRIAVWDGSAWSALGAGVSGGTSPTVLAIAAFDDDSSGTPSLYAAGRFTQAGVDAALNIARWDGVAWSPVGPGLNGLVRALLVHDEDGPGPLPPALFAAGEFTAAGSLAVPGIARWNGTEWSAVGTLLASPVGTAPMVHRMTAHDEDGSGPAPAALWITSTLAIPGGVGGVLRWDGVAWTDRPTSVIGITPTPIASAPTAGASTLYTTRPPSGQQRATPVLRLADPEPPAILAHSPPVRRIRAGSFSEGVAITVEPTIPVSYRWYRDGEPVATGPLYSGVFGSRLGFMGAARPEHAGEYHVVASSGGCELVTGPSTIVEVLCRADLNEDGFSDFADLLEFFDRFDSGDCRADLNTDGAVDTEDYEMMLAWLGGPC